MIKLLNLSLNQFAQNQLIMQKLNHYTVLATAAFLLIICLEDFFFVCEAKVAGNIVPKI